MSIKNQIAERIFGKVFHKKSLIGDKPFFDPKVLPISTKLEDNYAAIRREVDGILARFDDLVVFQDVSPNQAYIPMNDKWRMFFFKAAGIPFKDNQKHAPTIARIIKEHPEVCAAYISILGPKSYLNPHKGPWSGIVRMHLGVVIPPNEQCVLAVGEENYYWKEGEVVLFDDTYEHMALNASDGYRAILFLDIMRPLPQPYRFLNWMCLRLSLLSPYIIKAYIRHRKWQKKFYGSINNITR